jgi:hypothetical protein
MLLQLADMLSQVVDMLVHHGGVLRHLRDELARSSGRFGDCGALGLAGSAWFQMFADACSISGNWLDLPPDTYFRLTSSA